MAGRTVYRFKVQHVRVKMYKRIVLAYDGSVEGRTALREGALLAKQCGAEVFLLSVLTDSGALLLSEVALAGASVHVEDSFKEILDEGVARLKKLGFDPVAEMVRGQPAEEIGNFAKKVGADLIVVGHRRQSAFDRWWSGPKGAYLMDYTDCSLLVARNVISDEAIEALMSDSERTR
jgi:nucleotide-binding universal stress UspA family protein